MILGIGVDIISINRIKAIHDKYGSSFAKKLLSKSELEYFATKTTYKEAIEYLSGTWAAKEAVYKALYQSGHKLKNVNKIILERGSEPYPAVASPVYEGIRIHLSISHEHDTVIAYSIVEKDK